MLLISSPQNAHFKRVKSLQEKARKRKEEQCFVIEGEKEILHAQAGGFELIQLYLKEGHQPDSSIKHSTKTEDIKMVSSLFERLCYRTTSTVLAIAKCKSHALATLKLPQENPLILIAESPEKPGNIGALLRTADAMAVDAVILAAPKTELYNPNVIRSSVGCLFSVPIAVTDRKELFHFLAQKEIPVYSAALAESSKPYTMFDYSKATAIAVGTEDTGLSPEWMMEKSTSIIIPMLGKNDSLNVSVAAGILLAEVQRQRN